MISRFVFIEEKGQDEGFYLTNFKLVLFYAVIHVETYLVEIEFYKNYVNQNFYRVHF
jgi:hypothetical protein